MCPINVTAGTVALQQSIDARGHRLGGVIRSRQKLVDGHFGSARVEQGKVGKRPADVDANAVHAACPAMFMSVARNLPQGRSGAKASRRIAPIDPTTLQLDTGEVPRYYDRVSRGAAHD
jgi:hypothetical protein